jgi:ABC-type transport system substrate-binding protein
MSFWERYSRRQITRRRALAATGGAAAAAALLAACGGDSGDTGGQSQESGLRATPNDTTNQAKQGGVLRHFATAEPPGFEVYPSTATNVLSQALWTYPRLLKFKPGKHPDFASGDVEGDAAERYELTGDNLQLTFKMRRGMKWDSRAPTSGREIDATDVAATWEKFSSLSATRGQVLYSVAPESPVESLTTPDNQTVVVKLHHPDPAILAIFAQFNAFILMPREAGSGFNSRNETRGYGPYLLTKYEPSVSKTWTKNPDYYVKDRPFIDTVEVPLVPEYATRLSQFRAGGIWTHVAQPNDILQTKKDLPDLVLMQTGEFARTLERMMIFGYAGDSPWKDQRLRQALQMTNDVQAYEDVVTSSSLFTAEGLQVPVRVHSAVPAGWDGFWLNPLDERAFGPNAKYMRPDPAEAKKLLSAAGHPDGLTSSLFFAGGTQYGTIYQRTAQIIPGLAREAGITLRAEAKEYSSDYLPNYRYSYIEAPHTGFNGVMLKTHGSDQATLPKTLFDLYNPAGRHYSHMSPTGTNIMDGDPEINSMIERILKEFDSKAQQSLVHDLQRRLAEKAYAIPVSVAYQAHSLVWPVIQNYGLYTQHFAGVGIVEADLHQWIDPTKKPLAS